ncbi:hypothetical protein G9A89_018620 [Geosiphon pyriformis]|nr:hypothetical protein G9A89_018620 [Geosiphon pyriformis]
MQGFLKTLVVNAQLLLLGQTKNIASFSILLLAFASLQLEVVATDPFDTPSSTTYDSTTYSGQTQLLNVTLNVPETSQTRATVSISSYSSGFIEPLLTSTLLGLIPTTTITTNPSSFTPTPTSTSSNSFPFSPTFSSQSRAVNDTSFTRSSTLSQFSSSTLSLGNKDPSLGYNAPPLRTTLNWSNIIYGIFFIVAGTFEVFQGYKYIRITLFLMSYLFFSTVTLVILLLLNNVTGNIDSVSFYFAIWLFAGLTGGFLGYFYWPLGLMLTGAYGAFSISICPIAMANIESYTIRCSLTIALMISFVIAVHFFERYVIIITTSFGGAYTTMYGIDMFVGQRFRDMIELMSPDGYLRFYPDVPIYLMISEMIILAIFGIWYEFCAHPEPVRDFWWGNGHRREDSTTFEVISPNTVSPNYNPMNSRIQVTTTKKVTNQSSFSLTLEGLKTFILSIFGRKSEAQASLQQPNPIAITVISSSNTRIVDMSEV